LAAPDARVQLGVLAVGALAGLWLRRGPETAPRAPLETPRAPSPRGATLALGAYAGLLVLLPALAAMTGARGFAVADVFYRAGALVFGGGHVVLPLLRAELVPRGWITDATFLAGYAAAQAVPGPLFTLATYLGASLDVGLPRPLGAALATLALFLPGFLVVGGALPFWRRLRAHAAAQAALSGSNAAVVGILLAAAYDPVFVEAIFGPLDLALAFVAFAALQRGRVSPALVALGAALVGQGVAVLSLG
jgi:chromate transporter